MKFFVDAQLPPQLAVWLRKKNHHTFAVRDLGLRDAGDAEIWARADSERANIITKDDDFAEMAACLANGPQTLWVRCGNVVNRHLLLRFEASWPEIEELLSAGSTLVELR